MLKGIRNNRSIRKEAAMNDLISFTVGFVFGIWAGLVAAAGIAVWYSDKDNYWRERDVRDKYEPRYR